MDIIVYKELFFLACDLGVSEHTLYALSNHIGTHYKKVLLPKGNGEWRELHMPDKLLKMVQRRIAEKLLTLERVSRYATAYRPGCSPVANARHHLGAPVLLKMDIRHFFDHVIYPVVKEKVFRAERYSDGNRILLTLLCMYKDTLPQGAPTSPAISNIVMCDFDDRIGAWCTERGIRYTRYCDDLTFSGDFDPAPVKAFVREELIKMGFYPNDKKTVVLRNGQRKTVTGIVVNEKLNTASNYRKSLRQEVRFCQKYGVKDHLKHIGKVGVSEYSYLSQLLGRANYILQVDRDNAEVKGYKEWIVKQINKV